MENSNNIFYFIDISYKFIQVLILFRTFLEDWWVFRDLDRLFGDSFAT